MIPVSDELKQAVIHEVKPKSVSLSFVSGDISALNWYKEEPQIGSIFNVTVNAGGEKKITSEYDLFQTSKMNLDYLEEANYVIFSFELWFNLNPPESGNFSIRVSYKRSNGSYYIADSPTYNISDFQANMHNRVFLKIQKETSSGTFEYLYESWFRNVGTTNIVGSGFAMAYQQLTLSETDDTPDYTDIYATNENIEQYLRTTIPPISNENIISESFVYKESICSADTLKFGLCESSEIEIDVFDKNYDFNGRIMDLSLQFSNIQEKFEWKNFVIAESKKSYAGDIQKRHIVAYDKLKNLNESAYAWYTQYMWAMNLDGTLEDVAYIFDYGRQIFATYFNLAKAFGLESEDSYDAELIDSWAQGSTYSTREQYFLAWGEETGTSGRVQFCKKTVTPSSDYQAYMVDFQQLPITISYGEWYDKLYRGVRFACVYVMFHLEGGGTVGLLYDRKDPILLPQNCTSFDVYLPYNLTDTNWQTQDYISEAFEIYGLNFKYYDPNDLVNGEKPLPYYSYVYRKPTLDDIFKADSSITARDVMRSLMEMCGCFFRLDREGHPQFLYAMEHGLYPSNTLFPADDLFPRKSSELTMPTSYYIKANFEEYRVSNFGGVQVVVNTYDSQGAVVRWEYWGDESSDNAYLIDDNIFLCNSQFEYEPEMAGNVQELLENLWNVLNNMSYTPFTAETIGTPFLESGDRFTLLTKTDGFESFIFERTLKGIQVLKDYYEARGVAKTPRVKNFEWGNTNE